MSPSRGRGEVEVPDDDAHATEPAVSIPTWVDQSQGMPQETDPPPSLLPTWVDMSRGDEVEAREPHRRRIMPGQGRVDPVRMEDEVDDVVRALERDLPVLSHTPMTMLTGRGGATHDMTLVDSSDAGFAAAWARPSRRLVLVPESVVATPQSIQDREWEPTVSPVATEVFPMSDDADVEVAIVPRAAVGGPRRVVLVPFSPGTPRGSRFAADGSNPSTVASTRRPLQSGNRVSGRGWS